MNKKVGAVLLFVLLLLFWLILSFQVTVTIAIIGCLVSYFIVIYNYDLLFGPSEASAVTFSFVKKVGILAFVLIWNIVKSNIQVAKIVLSRKMPMDPGFVTIKNPLKKELNQALFANAITLTPGTLTVEMDRNQIIIHSLIKEEGNKLDDSQLEQAFIALEEVGK